MKNNLMKKLASLLCAVLIAGTACAAAAESLSLSGTVEAGETITLFAPVGGTVEQLNAEAGMRVTKGMQLAEVGTTKVYAPEDGTVTGVFAVPGDDGDRITETYGAALYLEGTVIYTVSGDVGKAYNAVDTTLIHSGEKVYIKCRTNTTRKGEGIVTAIDGTKYTVLVTSGEFIPGDSVDLFRDSGFTAEQRVGRGTVSRNNPIAISVSGAIVRVAVKDGDTVSRGDLLLETAEGTFAGYSMTGTAVTAPEDSIVASVSAEAGSTVSQNQEMIRLYPLSGIRVEALIPADDLGALKEGDPVRIELESDEETTYTGTVVRISALPEENTEEVSYRVYIDFEPDDSVTLGMNVIVTTPASAQGETAEEEPAQEEAAAEETAEQEASQETREKPERPAGMPEMPEGMELPEGFQPPEGMERPEMPEGAEAPAAGETPAD